MFAGFTDTVRVLGVVPFEGLTESQVESVPAVKFREPVLLVTLIVVVFAVPPKVHVVFIACRSKTVYFP